MTCGEIAWWRAPDLLGLLERHGQAEHLIVQFDFVSQVQRNGRAEYSIPGASKRRNGTTGYADIVSITTGEIWEIKPKHLEHIAFEEAAYYVTNAKASCGPQWHAGNSFTTSNRLGGNGVVYRIEGNGNKAELIAQQGRAGTVLYHWRINGKEVPSLAPYFAWAIRQQIVSDYFTASQPPQPLPGSKPPNNLPPGKFKPPVLRPDACIPQLAKYVPGLAESILTTCAQTVLENSTVAVLLESSVVNAMVGREVVADKVRMMQVKGPDPRATLYRETLTVLTGAGVAHGAVAAVVAGSALAILVMEGGVGLVGGVAVFRCAAVPVAGQAVATQGLMGAIAAGVRAALATRSAVAAGAAFVAFVVPRASQAAPTIPVAADVFLPKFLVLEPGGPKATLLQSQTIDGAEWIVVGLARTPPD